MRHFQADGSVWHSGELAVQGRAGVLPEARRLQDAIQPTIPDPFRAFVAQQGFAVLGTLDAQQRVWASLCCGASGFMHCPDRFSLRIDAAQVAGQVRAHLQTNPDMGMVVMDLANRRRIRVNGEGEVLDDGSLLVQAKQIYSNCPRYIQQRFVNGVASTIDDNRSMKPALASQLSARQQALVRAADTFFIASAHPEFGVDVSHRGGNPGFVRVESATRLLWPDYEGNKMFNTLGNIAENPRVGLMFPDFASGAVVEITGRAVIAWEHPLIAQTSGAQRMLVVDIDQVRESANPELLRYRLESYSPHNPA